jgi:hypothetical protein
LHAVPFVTSGTLDAGDQFPAANWKFFLSKPAKRADVPGSAYGRRLLGRHKTFLIWLLTSLALPALLVPAPALAAGANSTNGYISMSTQLPGYPVVANISFSSAIGLPVTGTVELYEGSRLLGSGTLYGGAVRLDLPPFPAGSYNLTARYSGDATYAPGEASLVHRLAPYKLRSSGMGTSAGTFNIWPDASGNVDQSGYPKSPEGERVSFTVGYWVEEGYGGRPGGPPPGLVPTGSVTFKDGNRVMGTVPLVDLRATITVDNLAPGRHSMSVAYSGDPNFEDHGGGGLFIDITTPPAVSWALTGGPTAAGRSQGPASPGPSTGSVALKAKSTAGHGSLQPAAPPAGTKAVLTLPFDLGV